MLHELVGFHQAAITCAEKQGIELPQFKDHTPHSNKGMEICWILMKSYT